MGISIGKLKQSQIVIISVILLALNMIPYVGLGGLAAYVILAMMFIMMTQAWSLLAGSLGEISFGHAAFMGIGAYTVAMNYNNGVRWWNPIPPPFDVALAGVNAALIALIVAYPFLRLRGIYFSVSMLGLLEVLRIYFLGAKNVWIIPPFFGAQGFGGEGILVTYSGVTGQYSLTPYLHASVILTIGLAV